MLHMHCICVIAEGVESKAHLTTLQELGCDSIQGFYLSQALPRTDISKLLREGIPSITKQRTNADIEETKRKIAEQEKQGLVSA